MAEFNLARLDNTDCQKDDKTSSADKLLDELLKSPYEQVMDLIKKQENCNRKPDDKPQEIAIRMPGKVGPVGPVGQIDDIKH